MIKRKWVSTLYHESTQVRYVYNLCSHALLAQLKLRVNTGNPVRVNAIKNHETTIRLLFSDHTPN